MPPRLPLRPGSCSWDESYERESSGKLKHRVSEDDAYRKEEKSTLLRSGSPCEFYCTPKETLTSQRSVRQCYVGSASTIHLLSSHVSLISDGLRIALNDLHSHPQSIKPEILIRCAHPMTPQVRYTSVTHWRDASNPTAVSQAIQHWANHHNVVTTKQ